MELIDKLHNSGIGAIMDFVPVHFAVDAYGLKEYDGTALYEYPHKDVGESEWGSYNFIHSRREVACFLQSAANYWLKEYHFDGLRMDAVSRLIYWQGDEKRGENGAALNFLKIVNQGLHRLHPTAMLIAEDSTAYPGKKLNFMGNELAMFREWDEKREPDWNLLNMPAHDSFHRYIGELNRLYLKNKPIWGLDHTYDGFKWVDCKSENRCVFGYTRTDGKQTLLAIFNFSDKEAAIAPEREGKVTMLLNTDWEHFGGNMKRSTGKLVPETIQAFCGMLFSLQ